MPTETEAPVTEETSPEMTPIDSTAPVTDETPINPDTIPTETDTRPPRK